jgi:hypothetical protein
MENLTIDNVGQLIGTIGFPSLVAIILLRTVIGNFNKRLDVLDKRLVQLNKSIAMVAKTMNEMKNEQSKDSLPSIPPVNEDL